MKKIIYPIVIMLTLFLLNGQAFAQNNADRCWIPDASQIQTINTIRTVRKKVLKRIGMTPHVFDEVIEGAAITQTQLQDPKFIRAAVECDGRALHFANESLRRDKNFALALAQQIPAIIQFFDEPLRKDQDVALTAVKYDKFAIMGLDDSLKKDRNFILTAMRESAHDWDIFKNMDDALKSDREIVLLAVKNHGELLAEADKRFRKDKEVVIAAVKSEKASYNRLAAEEDKSYRHHDVLKYAAHYIDQTLLNDPDVIEAANTKETEIRIYPEPCLNYCR